MNGPVLLKTPVAARSAMKYMFKKVNLATILLVACICSCNPFGKKEKFPTIPGYDLNRPTTVTLKTTLDEISGIIFYPKDTSVLAINDELGRLYKIYLRKRVKIDEWEFSEGADYEDIALVDSTFYALHSNGSLTKFRLLTADSLQIEECKIPLAGKNEFETLYFDEFHQKLVLICKDCKADKGVVSAYSFDPANKEFSNQPIFTVSESDVLSKLNSEEKEFKPSAAGIHPITKDLFIVSSVNKAIVIADRDGKVKMVTPLNPAVFKQPEGLSFSPDGDLLISNEAADVGTGNILIFKYNQQKP
jgi:uncharacterized protein YjiK